MSALCTPSYKLAKALVSILDPITKNDFTIKNSFEFSKEILEANPKYFMASLDVESLFTNIPLEETIKICSNLLYKNQNLVNSLDKDNFEKFLKTALSNNYFLFDGQVYQQIDSVSMGSSLGPSLANAFLGYYEKIWLKDCPEEFKPVFYKRYVDDIFVLFRSHEHLEKFNKYLNLKHKNIKFTSESESNDSLPYLDILISRKHKKFSTSVYHKPTFSGVYSNFNSFIAQMNTNLA